jgi:hypothetical protein
MPPIVGTPEEIEALVGYLDGMENPAPAKTVVAAGR